MARQRRSVSSRVSVDVAPTTTATSAGSAHTASQPLSVAQLTALIKGLIEPALPGVWVSAEISNLARPRSGHLYMTLKDPAAQIRGVVWASTAARLNFRLEEGQSVLAFGSVEVYAPHGGYQLIIRKIEPQGVGALQLAFEQLKQRLAAEGLFDADRKLSLPRFPRRVGIVTSPTGAAVRDFLEVALRRWPRFNAMVIPCQVQGTGATASIVAAIDAAHRVTPPLDVIVVTRGGGSLEDLWCFNEEPVVRAIASSRLPIVSAVGHEIDVTLADFAADVRALTPSEAAERVVPEWQQLQQTLAHAQRRLERPIRQRIEYHREQLRQLATRPALAQPLRIIQDRSRRLDELDLRSRRAIRQRWADQARKIEHCAAALSALSPLGVLARGYTVTQRADDGRLITASDQVASGQMITTRTAAGNIHSRVTSTDTADPPTGQGEQTPGST